MSKTDQNPRWKCTICNPGATSTDLLAALPSVIALHPDAIHILTGDLEVGYPNPITGVVPLNNIHAMVTLIQAAKIPIVIGLLPLQEVKALFLDEAGDLRGVPRNPDLVLTLECSLLSMLDLTDAGLLEQLGTSREELVAESPSRFIENARGRSTPCQQLGSACFRSGHISAIKAPSAANQAGFCIDILIECLFEGEFIRVRDDSGVLRAELVGQIPRSGN